MNWKSVEEKIVQDDQNKWDRRAASKELSVSNTGRLQVANGKPDKDSYALSELAVSEMCEKLDIAVKYYRRLPDEMKAVVANHDPGRVSDKSFFVRRKGDWVRAFLSSDYLAYNNIQSGETVQGLLNGAAVSVKNFVLEESRGT